MICPQTRKVTNPCGVLYEVFSTRKWRFNHRPLIESLEEVGNRSFTFKMRRILRLSSTFRERWPCLNPLRIIIPSRRAAWAQATI